MEEVLFPVPGPSSYDHTSILIKPDIHSGVFPVSALPFDVSLLQFETTHSSWREPQQWNLANKHDIDKILREVEICVVRTGLTIIKLAGSDMIYPVSTALQSDVVVLTQYHLISAGPPVLVADMCLHLRSYLGISY